MAEGISITILAVFRDVDGHDFALTGHDSRGNEWRFYANGRMAGLCESFVHPGKRYHISYSAEVGSYDGEIIDVSQLP